MLFGAHTTIRPLATPRARVVSAGRKGSIRRTGDSCQGEKGTGAHKRSDRNMQVLFRGGNRTLMGQAPRDFELRNCERSEGQEGFVASSYGRLCNTSPAASMPELGRVGLGRIGAVTFSVTFSVFLPATRPPCTRAAPARPGRATSTRLSCRAAHALSSPPTCATASFAAIGHRN